MTSSVHCGPDSFWPIGNFVISHALCASLMFITHKWTHIDWYFSTSSSPLSLAVFSGYNFCIAVVVFAAVCLPPPPTLLSLGKTCPQLLRHPCSFIYVCARKGAGVSEKGCSHGQFPPTDTINYINNVFIYIYRNSGRDKLWTFPEIMPFASTYALRSSTAYPYPTSI